MSYLLYQKVVMRGGNTQENAGPMIATVFDNYEWGSHTKLGVFARERDACQAIIQWLSSKELFTHATIRTAMEFDSTGVVVSMHYDKERVRNDIAFVRTRAMLEVLFEEYGGDTYAAKQWGFSLYPHPHASVGMSINL